MASLAIRLLLRARDSEEPTVPVLSSSEISCDAATLGSNAGVHSKPLCNEWAARWAALLLFRDPPPECCSRLEKLSEREWRRLLRWLHLSGLALYVLDRMVELELTGWMPDFMLEQLQCNLADNAERTRGMAVESADIQRDFQQAGLSYALLKGLSLWPIAVPRPELRSQFDLDYLVAERHGPRARRILERRGYRLYSISGRSWEFKRTEKPGVTLKDIYKPFPSHAVELHLEPHAMGRSAILDRVEFRKLCGIQMPVLARVDLFLGQALHLYKHLCGEFSRASLLLEFRRHALARDNDHAFWRSLRAAAESNQRTALGLGIVTLVITRAMGGFAPQELTSWTMNRLPASPRLWVEMYGLRAAVGSFPGTKLYLLLQQAMNSEGVPPRRTHRNALLPSRLPPPVIKAFPNEAMAVRISRYRMQLEHILLRLRFHFVEGFRYAWELHRWNGQRRRLGQ